MLIPSRPTPSALETDLYQLTMAYGYWREGKHEKEAAFDYFFRKCPFGGEFAVFAGLDDFLDFVAKFRFSEEEIGYLRSGPLSSCRPEFFDWLQSVDCSRVKIYSVREGSMVFPRLPLVRVEGPLAIAQLLETPLLAFLNFPSLMTTNALRFRLAAGYDKTLLEFGLRRAQDGLRASRYAWIGGFDSTSNVEAARRLGILPRGTMAHSFITSFANLESLSSRMLVDSTGVERDFVEVVLEYRLELGFEPTNEGELAAFVSYAQAFPRGFLALVDTYDTLESGVPNFISVALALREFGYKALGIRLDSGDLAYLSKAARQMFRGIEDSTGYIANTAIVASNDIDEKVLWSLREQGHEITVFGIGTHLAACSAQPAFGGVYKLVILDGDSLIKISNDHAKVTIPGRKTAYRLMGESGKAILDLIVEADAVPPMIGKPVLCCHPFDETKRVRVVPSVALALHELVWDGGKPAVSTPSAEEVKAYVREQVELLREDHLRPLNPAPYKVSLSAELYERMHALWVKQASIPVIK